MNERESGQALLLVLLAMATVVTVVTSVVARSISNVSVTSVEEDSLRAFSAAEAGIEEVLVTNVGLGENIDRVVDRGDSGDEAGFAADVVGFPEASSDYVYPVDLPAGETATVWFVSHDNDDNLLPCGGGTCFTGDSLRFCWGDPESGDETALELSVVFDSGSGLERVRANYDPNESRRGSNSFDSPDSGTCGIGDRDFKYRKDVDFSGLGVSGEKKFARVALWYNGIEQPFGVTGGAMVLPAQGRRIDSTGSAGDSTRKVEVFALYPDLPSVFDSAVFSDASITK